MSAHRCCLVRWIRIIEAGTTSTLRERWRRRGSGSGGGGGIDRAAAVSILSSLTIVLIHIAITKRIITL